MTSDSILIADRT